MYLYSVIGDIKLVGMTNDVRLQNECRGEFGQENRRGESKGS